VGAIVNGLHYFEQPSLAVIKFEAQWWVVVANVCQIRHECLAVCFFRLQVFDGLFDATQRIESAVSQTWWKENRINVISFRSPRHAVGGCVAYVENCILTECFDFRRIYVRSDVKHPSQRLVSKVIVVECGEIHWKRRSERMMSADDLFIAPSKYVPFPKRRCYLRFGFDCL